MRQFTIRAALAAAVVMSGSAFGLLVGASPASAAQSLTITTTSLPSATINSPYSATLQATGGTAPYSWQWVLDPTDHNPPDQFPPGLSFSDGTISGTPTQWGTFDFSVFVADAGNPQEQYAEPLRFTVNPLTPPTLTIATTSVPGASTGKAYSATLQASGGVPPYQWSIASGSLPSGLSLSSSGTISGTPELPQTSSFVVQVQDLGDQSGTSLYAPDQQTATEQLTIAVSGGVSSLDPTLQQLGNSLLGAQQNLTGVLGTVTNLLETIEGLVSQVTQTVTCLPEVLDTLLEHTPPCED
jgi:hypothetical protein